MAASLEPAAEVVESFDDGVAESEETPVSAGSLVALESVEPAESETAG